MIQNTNIAPLAQTPTPAVPFGDMQRLAEAVAKSGLFGIKTPDQALALMALAQAEGRHPATVARDYHIINGSPSKKAEAMQRDFLMAGGKIEWHELTDDAVDATFSHPLGGTARIRWDTARCKQAGLTGGNHAKFPRQMKRSRVVSEGVRTVWPLATSGMYVPEEVVEFAPQQQAATADTRADLDAFAAAGKPSEIVDAETGEVFDAAVIERDARAAAAEGTHVFRGYLRGIGREVRAILNGKVGTREEPGELLILAMRADDAMRSPDEPHSPAGTKGNGADNTRRDNERNALGGATDANPAPAGEINDLLDGQPRRAPDYRVKLTDETSDGWNGWHAALLATLDAGAPPAEVLRQNQQNIAIFEQVDRERHHKLMRQLEAR